jgi:hypothetical protein
MGLPCLRAFAARAAFLGVLISTAACSSTPPATPTPVPLKGSFEASYNTGSVPPPFNYSQLVEGTFEPDALAVHYTLTYNFRDALTPQEITAQGYSDTDDIDWSGRLTGKAFEDWRALIVATRIGPIPPTLPGADSFTVVLRAEGKPEDVGSPENRDAWMQLISALDKQARAETNNLRPEP